MKKSSVLVREVGCKGHFIASASCRWSRHTQVGNVRVSTVGDYWPSGAQARRSIGAMPGEFFETMVFETSDEHEPWTEGCGCRRVTSWQELECHRYATAGEAQAGHERVVASYRRKAAK